MVGWLLAVAYLAALGIGMLGAQVGLDRLVERVYAGAATFAAGGWLAFADLFGPFAPPLT